LGCSYELAEDFLYVAIFLVLNDVQSIIRNRPTLTSSSCFSWICSTFPCDGSYLIEAGWHAVCCLHLIFFKMRVLLPLDFRFDLGFELVRICCTVFHLFYNIYSTIYCSFSLFLFSKYYLLHHPSHPTAFRA